MESELVWLAAMNGDHEMAEMLYESARYDRCAMTCCDDPEDPECAKCWEKCAKNR